MVCQYEKGGFMWWRSERVVRTYGDVVDQEGHVHEAHGADDDGHDAEGEEDGEADALAEVGEAEALEEE